MSGGSEPKGMRGDGVEEAPVPSREETDLDPESA